MPAKPSLSVIVASYRVRDTIGDCLASLLHQTAGADGALEIIVVDSSSDSTAEFVAAEFPEVKLMKFSERKFCGDARNTAVPVARGDIVAFLDADCVAAPDWAERILEAHRLPALAIGGAIANGNPDSCVGWAAYFCEFSAWMPGWPTRWLDDIAAASMSYKRSAFDEFGRFIEGTYSSDTEFHWRLRRAGHRLRFQPAIVVAHRNIERPGKFLRHEFEHGRCFARVRAQAMQFSRLKAACFALLSPLIALKLFAVVAVRNLHNRIYLGRLLAVSPLLLLGLFCWSLGEGAGYAGWGWRLR
jgi:GT2 family glycosyltransferase